jgi:uncharacterized membrane protein YphA (DoxX/SURF4 family)
MNYRNLKPHETEGIIWGIIVTIMLAGGGVPPAFALVVGIIFLVFAIFVLEPRVDIDENSVPW